MVSLNPKDDGDSSLQDTQGSRDDRKIAIDQVGVKGLKYPIEILDRDGAAQSTVATISLSVNLPHQFKGTHMSRFVEVLNENGNLIHVDRIPEILKDVQLRLAANSAHLMMEFPYFRQKKAPVTGAVGMVDYVTYFDAEIHGKDLTLSVTVVVPVTTLCPCSKAISEQGAHNQRGYVSLSIQSDEIIWIEDMIDMVEQSASAPIYSLLKRPDEKYVTEQAYNNPVFVEDLVRNVAVRCNAHPRILWYRVEAENVESIHNHSAYAIIERTLE